MTININLQTSGSTLYVNGNVANGANMRIEVPLTVSTLTLSGSIIGDLYVSGTITALEIKTTIISSSIIYRSGSTKFGDSFDDIHEVTGSLIVNGNINGSLTGSVFASSGISGSLQRLTTGEPYLLAGPSINLTTQSNGSIVISNTFVVTASWADISASYVTLNTTGSLPNERALSASFGLLLTDNGVGSTVSFKINDNEIATLSGSTFFGPLSASGGLTGSLQLVGQGIPYLVAGNGIQTLTGTNGSILITASTGSTTSTNYSIPREVKNIIVSGTSGHVTMSLSSSPLAWEEHLFKDADGLSPTNNIIISASIGMRIDSGTGHTISSSYGRARLLFVGNNLWSVVGLNFSKKCSERPSPTTRSDDVYADCIVTRYRYDDTDVFV